MNEEDRDFIAKALQPVYDDLLEQSARTGALRYLVEQLYANTFIEHPSGFDAMLQAMVEKTRTAAQPVGPASAEVLVELQARTAVHLERFRLDVLRRISQGRQAG
jgi:hypothetical protein